MFKVDDLVIHTGTEFGITNENNVCIVTKIDSVSGFIWVKPIKTIYGGAPTYRNGTPLPEAFKNSSYCAPSDLFKPFGKIKKKRKRKPKYTRYFIYRSSKLKKVQVIDMKTRKVVAKAPDVGVFFTEPAKLGHLKGISGYVQEKITEKFCEYYYGTEEYTVNPSNRWNYAVVKPKGVFQCDLDIDDRITGMKGLQEEYWETRED